MYKRKISELFDLQLKRKDIILLFGARQTGKSTLLEILSQKHNSFKILNCEQSIISDTLREMNIPKIIALFDSHEIIAFDEAQTIPEIGKILKLLFDDKKIDTKFIATGSSSFELSNKTGEPLTGRNISFKLFPLSINEISEKKGWQFVLENLHELLIYGFYPGVIDLNTKEKRLKLLSLSNDYLFKDIFKFEQLRNPEVLRKLLKAIALQVGNLVSYQELASLIGVSKQTIERYLDLLEKSFIVFKLGSFSGNLRNELKKRHKYYFYDTGIRNAIINNFADVNDRVDIGAIWENFCVAEIIKTNSNKQIFSNFYFWRNYDVAEIDLVE
jgi:predicted AAA+ superfamily ATPase